MHNYVIVKRMELAKILVEQRNHKISEIAAMVGYANTSHFITTFYKTYGMRPGDLTKYIQKTKYMEDGNH